MKLKKAIETLNKETLFVLTKDKYEWTLSIHNKESWEQVKEIKNRYLKIILETYFKEKIEDLKLESDDTELNYCNFSDFEENKITFFLENYRTGEVEEKSYSISNVEELIYYIKEIDDVILDLGIEITERYNLNI